MFCRANLFVLALIVLTFMKTVRSVRFGIDEHDLFVDHNGVAMKELGDQKVQHQQYDEALECYAKALKELEGDNRSESRRLVSEVYYSISKLYEFSNTNNKFQKALEACNQAISNCEKHDCNDYIHPYARRAELYVYLGDYDYAMADYLHIYDIVVSHEPSNADLTFNINKRIEELKLAKHNIESGHIKSHYEILGLDPMTSSIQDIKKAYRKLALMYHPDRLYNSNRHIKELNVEKFKRVQEAYDTLSDEQKKAQYDRRFGY